MLASPTTQGLAAFTWMAPVAAATKPAASADDPVEAPTAASNYWLAMGVLHALGCPQSCMPWGVHNFTQYVCMRVCLSVFDFSNASLETLGGNIAFSICDAKI